MSEALPLLMTTETTTTDEFEAHVYENPLTNLFDISDDHAIFVGGGDEFMEGPGATTA
jgi:hypothetical protein